MVKVHEYMDREMEDIVQFPIKVKVTVEDFFNLLFTYIIKKLILKILDCFTIKT